MMRVFELARELEMTSKDLISDLEEIGIVVKNHMSALNEEQLEQARRDFSGLVPAEEEPKILAEEPVPDEADAAPAAEAPGEAPAESAESAEAESETPAPEAPPAPAAPEAPPGVVYMKQQIVVKELATLIGVKPNVLIAQLMRMNIFATINDRVDFKTAQQLGAKHDVKVEHEKPPEPPKPAPKPEPRRRKIEAEARPDELASRPPVVTFMGHVDHGKTSLLDFIRKSKVVDGEAGGITQHIGAYMVEAHDKPITFIDTPGHAAFTQMRARGANLTDIAVIVIAAEEGIMPQTREAIQHAQAANVAMIIALNKVDLPAANVERCLQQLQQEGLTPEQWGGQTICVPVSAATGQGIDDLLEMILLQAEVMELKANAGGKGRGFVLEARLEPGRGPTATLLVKSGTLHVGDAILCGDYWGRVKALVNDRGIKVRTAGPSHPIQCLGLTDVPQAGAEFEVLTSDRDARSLSEERIQAKRLDSLQSPKRGLSLDDLLSQTDASTVQKLPVVLKTDVQGTLEAIQQSLLDIESDKVKLSIILGGVGNVTGNDVLLAKASNAIIIGFHVGTEDGVNRMARREGVEIRLYSIIYELLDEVRNAMAGLLAPIARERAIGAARVQQVFQLSRKGIVAGCLMRSGRVTSRARARIKREGDVVYEGSVASLKRFQNDAAEVREGQECGIRLDNYTGYVEGDTIEFYEVDQIAQEL